MAYFSTNDFISKVRNKDLARPNRFEVFIRSPNGRYGQGGDRDISLLCEEAAIPGLVMTYSPVKYGHWTENRLAGVEYFGDNAQMTFIVDSDWDARGYFEAWMNESVDPVSKEVTWYDGMVGEITIIALDRKDNIVGEWTLVDAFPRLLSLTPLSQSGGEAPVRVNVSFAYRHWYSYALNDDRSRLGKFLNIRTGSLKERIKGGIQDSVTNVVEDTLNRIF